MITRDVINPRYWKSIDAWIAESIPAVNTVSIDVLEYRPTKEQFVFNEREYTVWTYQRKKE